MHSSCQTTLKISFNSDKTDTSKFFIHQLSLIYFDIKGVGSFTQGAIILLRVLASLILVSHKVHVEPF